MFLDWGYVFWGRRPQSGLFASYHVKATCYLCDITVDVNLDRLHEGVFVRFSTVKLPFCPSFRILWKKDTMCSPCLNSGD